MTKYDDDLFGNEPYNAFESDIADENTKDSTSNISTTTKPEDKKMTIEYFGVDLTKEVKDGYVDPVIGREKEINQMIYTLLRKTKNNPLLIGEAGVGKTAVVEGLAQKIISQQVPEKLLNKKIFMLDVGTLLAGTKYRGEFEARLKAILEEASDHTNNIILFIDELHTIIGAGNQEGAADVANMLKPLLARGKIKLIGATTFDEYQKHIEKDAALKRRFQEILVNEPNVEDTIAILEGLKVKFEEFHGVVLSDEALHSVVHLSKRYILNKHFPDKALDIIDEAAARKSTMTQKLDNNTQYKKLEDKLVSIQQQIEKAIEKQDYFFAAELKEQENDVKKKLKDLRAVATLPVHLRPTVSKEDVGVVFADKLGIPAHVLNESDIDKLKKLDGILKGSLLGQDDVVSAMSTAIKRNKLSIIQKTKPIASFLFLGPSGVGKTFLAKLVAKHVFDDEKSLIRVDMSEYMEKYSVSKLIGSAPGYVGYEESGVLTEAVRRKPYSVILFDEIEKASPDILNILLQILDEGHLKDNKGRWIDFKSTIIILTSNLGSDKFSKKLPNIGFSLAEQAKKDDDHFEQVRERVMDDVKQFLAPELLNRLDKTVVFRPLSKDILAGIFKNKYKEFTDQWKVKEHITIPKMTDKKVKEIVDEIYDPQFGARPVERYIFDKIEPQIIDQLLK